jgi:hypothetical protein
VALEYVLMYRQGAGGQYEYELAYEVNDENAAQVLGLIAVDALAALHDKQNSATQNHTSTVASLPENISLVAPGLRVENGPVATVFKSETDQFAPITSLAAKNVGVIPASVVTALAN